MRGVLSNLSIKQGGPLPLVAPGLYITAECSTLETGCLALARGTLYWSVPIGLGTDSSVLKGPPPQSCSYGYGGHTVRVARCTASTHVAGGCMWTVYGGTWGRGPNKFFSVLGPQPPWTYCIRHHFLELLLPYFATDLH